MPDTINTTETIDDFGLLFLFDVVSARETLVVHCDSRRNQSEVYRR